MKIAAITDDGQTISQHFGRARRYVVLTIEDGEVADREVRDKAGHHHFRRGGGHGGGHGGRGGGRHHDAGGRHGYGADAEDRHRQMTESIADCDVLLCRGMGWGAYEHMQQAGITPIVTDIADIEEAARAYLDGTIVDHRDQLH